MKKLLKWAVFGLIVVLLLLAAAIFWIDTLARHGIVYGANYALDVPTTLGRVSIGILSGKASLSNLNVSNPKGYNSDHFMTLKDGSVVVTLGSLTSDVIEIPKLELSGIDVNLEKDKDGKANYDVILNNLKRLESGQKQQAEPTKAGKKYVIKELVIKDVTVHAQVLGPLPVVSQVVVPEIKIMNFGSGGKASMADLSDTVIKTILMSAVANGKGILPDDMIGGLSNGLSGLTSLAAGGMKVVGDLSGQIGNLGQGVGKTLEGATKGLGDLFGPKKEPNK